MGASVTAFRLMRELRATNRSIVRERELWLNWSPTTAQLALREFRHLVDFVDVMRSRSLVGCATPPRDISSN